MLNILSLGAGVQSSTVLLMSCKGILPKLDYAIFADTGWEPKAVYEWLDNVLEPEAAKAGIPIHRVSKGNLREVALRSVTWEKPGDPRFVNIPMFTLDEKGERGQLMRQCTKEFKIEPVEKKIKELWGDQDRKAGSVSQWMGISGDEMRRMRTSRHYWIMFYYPLVFAFDRPWHRHDCVNWMKMNGYPEAPRSACIGCPYHSDEEWRNIKARPDEWADALDFDAAMRKANSDMVRAERYLHAARVPLGEVDLESLEQKGQQNWLSECEGMCGA